MILPHGDDFSPGGSDAGIDDDQMNGASRKILRRLPRDKGGADEVLRRNLVGDVD